VGPNSGAINMMSNQILDFDIASLLLIVSLGLVALTSFQLMFCKNLLQNIILMSVFSLFISICYLLMDAPDVAMTEVALGACLSTMILLFTIKKFAGTNNSHPELASGSKNFMHEILSQAQDDGYSIVISLTLCILFIITLTCIGMELPIYGDGFSAVNMHVSKYYIENTANDIGIPSIVAGVLASYRGFDTLGETSVILIAGLSVVLILSEKEDGIKDENA
jgi:multicomponent Na+:H+ antiporter subunit B